MCTLLLGACGAPEPRSVQAGRGARAVPREVLDAPQALLGGSWGSSKRVLSMVILLITLFRVLITLLITTYEPPSRP